MSVLTDNEAEEYKIHIFLGNCLIKEAETALKSGCTFDALSRLKKAIQHFKDAYLIVANKSSTAMTEALVGVNRCEEMIKTIKSKDREK